MKKVIFVITKSNWGGAQRYVYNLATLLPHGDFDVSVALGGTGEAGSQAGELETRLRTANIPTFYIPSFARDISLFSDIRAIRELYLLFKKEKPDAVHLNSSKAGGLGALAARFASWRSRNPIKIIFTSHGLVWDEDRNYFARQAIKLFSWATFLLSTQVVVISKDNVARAQSLPFCRTKTKLIYNGLPTLQFETRERARISLALKVGLHEDGNGFWIGIIAELTQNKGLVYLIDAAKILKDSGRAFQLFIIGSGEEEQNLKNHIQKIDLEHYVHVVGFVSDAYRYNRAFDIFTLTSIKEGLPTVLLEAGQAGIPALATNIPGCRDIVEDGVTGLLTLPKNPKDTAEKIILLMDNTQKRAALGRALEKKVESEFSIEQMLDATQKLY